MKFLVTGVTGTLGQVVTRLLLEDGHDVIGYSRDELKQSQIPSHERLTLYLGDVRDRDRIIEAARDADQILHFAALKRIDKAEENPEEAIATNITGTANVLHAQRLLGIPRVMLSSTDKAVRSVSTYGSTKLIAERLVLRNARNIVCRWGNVLASRGSVIDTFVDSILKDNEVKITDRRMTRFWIRQEDAAMFLYRMTARDKGGMCIPDVKAYPVLPMALLIAKMLGKPSPRINEVGLRTTEKIHEELRLEDEGGYLCSSDKSLWYTEREMRDLLEPLIQK